MSTAWRKSSCSYGSGNCVEVQFAERLADGRYSGVIVEDSSRPYGNRVIVDRDVWHRFLTDVKGGYRPV